MCGSLIGLSDLSDAIRPAMSLHLQDEFDDIGDFGEFGLIRVRCPLSPISLGKLLSGNLFQTLACLTGGANALLKLGNGSSATIDAAAAAAQCSSVWPVGTLNTD